MATLLTGGKGGGVGSLRCGCANFYFFYFFYCIFKSKLSLIVAFLVYLIVIVNGGVGDNCGGGGAGMVGVNIY